MTLHSHFVAASAVRTLVRDLLQCGRSESVFADVRIGVPSLFDTHALSGGLEILVGQRLLVTLVPLASLTSPAEAITTILTLGRKVRDDHGFNRFRLVVVGSPSPEARSHYSQLPAACEDRVHLHFLEERNMDVAFHSGNPTTA